MVGFVDGTEVNVGEVTAAALVVVVGVVLTGVVVVGVVGTGVVVVGVV